MSAPADLPFDLDSLPPAVREEFAAMQAKVAGLEAHTEFALNNSHAIDFL